MPSLLLDLRKPYSCQYLSAGCRPGRPENLLQTGADTGGNIISHYHLYLPDGIVPGGILDFRRWPDAVFCLSGLFHAESSNSPISVLSSGLFCSDLGNVASTAHYFIRAEPVYDITRPVAIALLVITAYVIFRTGLTAYRKKK